MNLCTISYHIKTAETNWYCSDYTKLTDKNLLHMITQKIHHEIYLCLFNCLCVCVCVGVCACKQHSQLKIYHYQCGEGKPSNTATCLLMLVIAFRCCTQLKHTLHDVAFGMDLVLVSKEIT